MKTSTLRIHCALILGLAAPLVRADVTLGDASFDTTSADVAADWFEPMTAGSSITLEGYGENDGKTRTISYSAGGDVAGVATVKRKTVEGDSTEEVWIAFDAADNARVLKVERAGAVAFEAAAGATPPLYLPATPEEGQTWTAAGATITLEVVIASASGYRLQVKSEAAGKSETNYLHAGEGLTLIQSGADSGWRVKKPDAAE
jgi:hypothetical protein